jgi:hypothetical protein
LYTFSFFFFLCVAKKKRLISDKDEDNVSDPPSKKVHMSESDALEQETESEKYIVLMTNLMMILTGRLTSLHSAKSYAPFSRPLKKGKARDISEN